MDTPRNLPAIPLDLVFIEPVGDKAGVWKVQHRDGTVLYEAPTEGEARNRLYALQGVCKIRLGAGRPCSGSDLMTMFPPTAPAPLVMGALAADELQREDVFDSSSGTWTMRNVEIFRSGVALKRTADGWVKLHFVPDDTRNLVEAFAALGWTPPVKVTHGSEQPIVLEQLPALARVAALKAAEVRDPSGEKQLGAFADLEKVPEALRAAIRDGRLYGRSIEFWRDQIPRTDGKEGKWPLVLKAVALLGEELPAVRGMAAIDVAPEKFSVGTSSETVKQEAESMDPALNKDGKVIQLSVEDYEKLTRAADSTKAEAERLAAENKAMQSRLAKLEIDRRSEGATNAAARLREAGKITPAQEQNVAAILAAADDEKTDAVTVTTLGTDGKAQETKKSQRAALLSLLDSMPKHPNTPGAGATRGDGKARGSDGGSNFAALDAGAKDKAVTRLWNKLCVDAKVEPNSKAGHALYAKARTDLASGAADVPSEEVV